MTDDELLRRIAAGENRFQFSVIRHGGDRKKAEEFESLLAKLDSLAERRLIRVRSRVANYTAANPVPRDTQIGVELTATGRRALGLSDE